MMDITLDGFVCNLAAGLAQALVTAAVGRLRNKTMEQALQSAYERAFAVMLMETVGRSDRRTREIAEERLSEFISVPEVAQRLLDLSLVSDDMPLDWLDDLRLRFYAGGYDSDPSSLGFSFDRAMSAFIEGLVEALAEEARQPGSPLLSLVSVSKLEALQRLLRMCQGMLDEALCILRRQEARAIIAEYRRVASLRNYKRALHSFCDHLSYVTLPGAPLPPLSQVFIERVVHYDRSIEIDIEQQEQGYQSSIGSQRLAKPRPLALRPISVAEALKIHRHLYLEGGPGMGKSSLLRYMAINALQQSQMGRSELIPVLVSARGFAARKGSLSDCLLAQVKDDLGKRYNGEWPAGFFAQPPAGCAWLVLLDGLDEVVAGRAGLVEQIREAAEDLHSPYRFVVTSRPIAEAVRLGAPVFGHYTIRPFEPGEVLRFAQAWFEARSTNACQDVARFVSRVEESRIGDLAQVPLLLTLAAIVYEQDRNVPLPTCRAGLYARYLDILLEDEEEARRTRETFRSEWDARFGYEGVGWADTLFSSRLPLLQHIALWRLQGGRGSLVDQATHYAYEQKWLPRSRIANRPSTRESIRQRMAVLMQRTGLINLRKDGEAFIHDSVREYLAAAALADDADPCDEEAWTYIDRWDDDHWREVILFLLGVWSERDLDVGEPIQRIWHGEQGWGESPLLFVGAALADGIKVTAALDQEIIEALLELARRPWAWPYGSSPLDPLARLRGRAQVVDQLYSIASRQPSVIPQWARADAATCLGRLGRVEEVRRLADDAAITTEVRVAAAAALGRLGQADEAAARLALFVFGADSDYEVQYNTLRALELLGRVGELQKVADNPSVPLQLRIDAASGLGRLGRAKDAVERLMSYAREARYPIFEDAIPEALRELGRVEELRQLAEDGHILHWIRRCAEIELRVLSKDTGGTGN